MVGLLAVVKRLAKDSDFQHLTIFVLMIILIGTVFYNQVEAWGWLDSVYFSVMTLTTVGYGDFYPVTSIGKLFTIFYVIIGLGILLGYIKIVADIVFETRAGLLNIISDKTKDIRSKRKQKKDLTCK